MDIDGLSSFRFLFFFSSGLGWGDMVDLLIDRLSKGIVEWGVFVDGNERFCFIRGLG